MTCLSLVAGGTQVAPGTNGGPMLKISKVMNLGSYTCLEKELNGTKDQAFEKYGKNNIHNNNWIECLLLSYTETLEKDKRLRVINWQLKTKCEIQRVFLVAYKEDLISSSGRAEKGIN